MLNFFNTNFTFFLFIYFIFGLAIGSFLNVVIYRLPVMLKNSWRKECCEFLAIEAEANKPFNLILPRSQCPHCEKPLRSWHNVPILSYLFLKAKCAYCKQSIAWRYPFIEILTGLFTVFIAAYYGTTWQCLAVLLFTYCLLVLTFIDFDQQLLPDSITLPLLWLGLLLNINGIFVDLTSAVIGTAVGYLSLWIIAKLFELLTGKVGMGHGDFKLLALIGAWIGWQLLPLVLLLASLLGAIVGISLILFKKQGRHVPISFGPYLAIAGWLGLLFHQQLPMLYEWIIF